MADGGVITGPVSHLAGLFITPLVTITPDLVTQMGLDALIKHFRCGTNAANDVKPGDILTVYGQDYPVHMVNDWPFREHGAANQSRKELIVTEHQQGG